MRYGIIPHLIAPLSINYGGNLCIIFLGVSNTMSSSLETQQNIPNSAKDETAPMRKGKENENSERGDDVVGCMGKQDNFIDVGKSGANHL